jgi:hypothetical protein
MKKIFVVRANKALWFLIGAKASFPKEDCMSAPHGIGWAIYEPRRRAIGFACHRRFHILPIVSRMRRAMTTRSMEPLPTVILTVEAK